MTFELCFFITVFIATIFQILFFVGGDKYNTPQHHSIINRMLLWAIVCKLMAICN